MANSYLMQDDNSQPIQVLTGYDVETDGGNYIGEVVDTLTSQFSSECVIRVRFKEEDAGIAFSSSDSSTPTNYITAGENHVEYFSVRKDFYVYVTGTVEITIMR